MAAAIRPLAVLGLALLLSACTPEASGPRPVTEAAGAASANPALLARVRTPEHRTAVAAAAARFANEIGCRDARFGEPEPPTVWRPRTGPATLDGQPTEIAWLEGVPIANCPLTDRVVVLTSVVPGRPPATDAVQAGHSLSDPQLMRDVIRHAMSPLAAARFAGCGDVRLVHTQVTRQPTARNGPLQTSSWAEHWTVAGCGVQRHLEVVFTPDATGTGFTAREVPAVPPLPLRRALGPQTLAQLGP